MSYESDNQLPKAINVKDVIELIESLGYKKTHQPTKGEIAQYQWFELEDYKSWSGVELSILKNDGCLNVYTRTNISRSYWDLIHQNHTIKVIKKRFGGNFRTDVGKNRYFHLEGEPPLPQQSGCHLAFQIFGVNLIRADIYLMNRNFPNEQWEKTGLIDHFDEMNPRLLSNNMLVPYLVSIMEDYFKSTFIALLKYSPKKEYFFKKSRLSSSHLVKISNREISVEDAVAEMLSFQNISAICNNINKLDNNLDLSGVLKRPYRKRKKKLYDDLESLLSQRHVFIHKGIMNIQFEDKKLKKAMKDLEVSVCRCYRAIINRYDWQYEKDWYRGKMA